MLMTNTWDRRAFQSLFSHIDGRIGDGYGEDGCGRLILNPPFALSVI
jgi:hypothetical protein